MRVRSILAAAAAALVALSGGGSASAASRPSPNLTKPGGGGYQYQKQGSSKCPDDHSITADLGVDDLGDGHLEAQVQLSAFGFSMINTEEESVSIGWMETNGDSYDSSEQWRPSGRSWISPVWKPTRAAPQHRDIYVWANGYVVMSSPRGDLCGVHSGYIEFAPR